MESRLAFLSEDSIIIKPYRGKGIARAMFQFSMRTHACPDIDTATGTM